MSDKNNIAKTEKRGKKSLSALVCRLLAVVLCATLMVGMFTACGSNVDEQPKNELDQSYDKDRESIDLEELTGTILPLTEDAGKEYIDETLFIGDSNTVRTQIYGHTTWDNVVAAVSMGVQHITSLKMTYFKGYAEPVTVPEAVKIIQPKRIIITYGTNNSTTGNLEDFIKTYKEGLEAIKKAYPYADIIINSIPPVDKDREYISVTMQAIDQMNKAIAEMAEEEGYKFLNSTEVLKDEETGFAKKDYTIGDGVHLSKLGMDAMMEYFRTHAYITEDTRPQPLKKVPEREETPTGIISEDPIAVRGTRIKITFQTSNSNLGRVDGEIEQKIKRTITSQAVTATPIAENGGIFTGWSCSYEGLSSTTDSTVTFTVPKVGEDVTEIVVYANFEKVAVSLNEKSISVNKGDSKQLKASLTNGFTGNGTVTWTSKDESIAKVDKDGKVTGVKAGKTQVVASILGGSISAVCDVEIKPEPNSVQSVSISKTELTVNPGDTATLTAQPTLVYPDRPEGVDISAKWSSEKGYVTVSGGTVTVKTDLTSENGTLTDKVTVTIGGKSASCTITIKNVTLLCSKCNQTGHGKDAHCKWCDAVDCTAAHCEKCGKTDHGASAHCKWCDEANCTKPHCAECGKTDHRADAHCATCKALDHVAADHCTGKGCTNIKCTLTHCAECGGTDHAADAHCTTCKQLGHVAADHCTGINCTNIKCTLTHCAQCGGTDHSADAHCTLCGRTNHTPDAHCATCQELGHTASAHCATCGSLDQTEHPAEAPAENTEPTATETAEVTE